jgi:2-polyprenyl-6-methoxyphenol hydroxylase-like FAD-dependent oxidoreductase
VAALKDLKHRQENLIKKLEQLQPTGYPAVDQAWRSGIQSRFAATVTEEHQKRQLLSELARGDQPTTSTNTEVLDRLRQGDIDVRRLPEDHQRALYDAFHLELRYNSVHQQFTIRVTVTGDAASAIAPTVGVAVTEGKRPQRSGPGADAPGPGPTVRDVLCAPPGTRTPNPLIKRLPHS